MFSGMDYDTFVALTFGLGAFSVFVGFVLAVLSIATSREDRKNPSKYASILFIFGGILLQVFWGSNEAGSTSTVLGIISYALIAIAVALLPVSIKHLKRLFENKKKREFYDICIKEGIENCISEKNREKASLIAQSKNLSYNRIEELYSEAKTLVGIEREKDNAAKLEKKLDEEKRLSWEWNKYSNYSKGREKRIAMLTDEVYDAEQRAKEQHSMAYGIVKSGQQKEQSWGLYGGLASGIAGPAAGLAAAMDVQAKNAQIRAQNAAWAELVKPVSIGYTYNALRIEDEAKFLKSQLESATSKLVSDAPASEVFECVAIYDVKVGISETGTAIITAMARMKKQVSIYDNLVAVIDGTIIAHVFEDKKEIGSTVMVLPALGICDGEPLRGIILSCADPKKDHFVSFEAGELWYIEK